MAPVTVALEFSSHEREQRLGAGEFLDPSLRIASCTDRTLYEPRPFRHK